jgi:AraC-like DNA-binding protein
VDGPPEYREWAPPAALRGAVACLWSRVVDDEPAGAVLPDGCADVIWQRGVGAFVAGPDTGPAEVAMAPGTVLVGLRFRPGAGGAALGLPLAEVRDQRVDLADLGLDAVPADLEPDRAGLALTDLAGRWLAEAEPDPLVQAAVTALHDPQARVAQLGDELGVSERQLRRRCHHAVGYGPKTLHRVLRFRRFLDALSRGRPAVGTGDLAQLAAHTGYADQAHLTRECQALAGMTPGQLAAAAPSQG